MRTVIYARYSSQLQNPRSIEDQIAACRERAAREGWTIAGIYDDHAISGAAGLDTTQRPGLHAMLAHVEAGGVDQVLTEATDRIARHQGDAFAVRERLQYAGARLFTLIDGEVDEITGTIKGLFDARMRKDLAHRVRRGHVGNINQGRAASGIAYGYRRVPHLDERGEPVRGLREIEPDQAEIVQRIYHEYAAGQSALAIAKRLNVEGISPPRRGIWRASTLIGHRAIGFGILCNPIYVGRLSYGRSKSVVDPRTRERRTKPGTGGIHEGWAPHLRIITDALFDQVQEQIERRSSPSPERQRRPKHVLSGIGQCGICGSNWIITRKGYWGCSRADAGHACANRRLIRTEEYERRVLDELKGQMLAPDVVSAYLREYHREHARVTATMAKDRDRTQRKFDEAARKVQRLVDAVAAGGSDFAEIRELLTGARDERDRLAKEMASMEALPILSLHPGLADQYRREVAELEQSLADEATRLEAVPKLRKLIARVVAIPADAPRGVALEVVRQIDEVLKLAVPRLSSSL
ncbi:MULTISPECIES: recombinase family protein [unclassified Sphingomonas]|uniref:recombinase family protein n=1 Tax=unclassified Sphingomonas TaxID=196159 RepID=UPI002269B32D